MHTRGWQRPAVCSTHLPQLTCIACLLPTCLPAYVLAACLSETCGCLPPPACSINAKGDVGPMSRPGRPGQSCACGALIKSLSEISTQGLTCNCKIPGGECLLQQATISPVLLLLAAHSGSLHGPLLPALVA